MDNNVIKSIDKIILVGHDQEGNEVHFNFTEVNNCVVTIQTFGGWDISFHANSHTITYDGEELFPVQSFARSTKCSEFDKRDSVFGKNLQTEEISW